MKKVTIIGKSCWNFFLAVATQLNRNWKKVHFTFLCKLKAFLFIWLLKTKHYGLVQEVSADEIIQKNKRCGLAAVKCLLQQLFSFVQQENF